MTRKKGTKTVRLACLCSLLLLFTSIPSILDAAIPDIVLNQKKAVATIFINDKDGQPIATASGFLIDENGIVATNYHVVSHWHDSPGSTILLKMENGAFYPVQNIISLDQNNDIALIKVGGKGLPIVRLATRYRPKQGESVVVIGSPEGLETTVSNGIVSAIRSGGMIQITAPISPGSSGSPVLNSKGEAIGIATFIIKGGQNLNFAYPASRINSLLTEYKKPKKTTSSPPTFHSALFDDLPGTNAPSPNPDRVNKLEKAKAEVHKNPDDADAYIDLSFAYGISGMYREAAEAAKQAIKRRPDDGEGHFRLGLAYCYLGQYKEALAAFKQAMRLPNGGLAYLAIGDTYDALGMHREAMESYEEVKTRFKYNLSHNPSILHDPNLAQLHFMLGIFSLKTDDRDAAFEEYKILKDLNQKKADELFNMIYK